MAILDNKLFIYSVRAISWLYLILVVLLNLFNAPILLTILFILGLNFKRNLYPYNPTFEKVAMVVLIIMLVFSMTGFRLG